MEIKYRPKREDMVPRGATGPRVFRPHGAAVRRSGLGPHHKPDGYIRDTENYPIDFKFGSHRIRYWKGSDQLLGGGTPFSHLASPGTQSTLKRLGHSLSSSPPTVLPTSPQGTCPPGLTDVDGLVELSSVGRTGGKLVDVGSLKRVVGC